MENAAEALRMAGGVLIFVLALTISINAFTNTRQGVDALVLYGDREFLTTYVEQNKGTKRIVGTESIVPTIYRAYKENIKINFEFLNNNFNEPLYTKDVVGENGKETKKITYIDLSEEIHGDENLKDFFIKKILFGDNTTGNGKFYSRPEEMQYLSQISNINFNRIGLYERLTTGDLSHDTYKESLGVYFLGEENGTSDKSTINKTEKKVITYDKVDVPE